MIEDHRHTLVPGDLGDQRLACSSKFWISLGAVRGRDRARASRTSGWQVHELLFSSSLRASSFELLGLEHGLLLVQIVIRLS